MSIFINNVFKKEGAVFEEKYLISHCCGFL